MSPDVDPGLARRRRFEALVSEVYDPLQRYLRRRVREADAWDLLGDVLLVLWRRLDDVPEGGALAWCYGVARRTVANHRRTLHRRARLQERLEAEPWPRQVDAPGDAGEDPVLAAALASLSPGDQELLRLWAWEGLEPREIAAVLGTTANAVSLRLGRARRRLAREVERQDHAPAGHTRGGHTEGQRP